VVKRPAIAKSNIPLKLSGGNRPFSWKIIIRSEKTTILINIEIKTPLSWAVFIPRRIAILPVLKEKALRMIKNSPIIFNPFLKKSSDEARRTKNH
jgi:hypothetical protein